MRERETFWGKRGVLPLPQVHPNGKGHCRWCGKPVPKGSRSWCSQACIDDRWRREWKALRLLVLRRDRVCLECGSPHYHTSEVGAPQPDGRSFEVDHIVSIADGGDDNPENLRLLCLPCHQKRTKQWHHERATARREGDAISLFAAPPQEEETT